ncbi:hypothetical protein A2U01_0111968, partial [Trifolium medium]|nr:hypothetical protein [Trifolium medium]
SVVEANDAACCWRGGGDDGRETKGGDKVNLAIEINIDFN